MKRYTGILFDDTGKPQAGVAIKVVDTGTTVLAALQDDNGTSIANPVTTASDGTFTFVIFSGVYDFLDTNGLPLQKGVQIYDLNNIGEWFKMPSTINDSVTFTGQNTFTGDTQVTGVLTSTNLLLAQGIGIATTNCDVSADLLHTATGGAGHNVAFFNATPTDKQTVTGSRGGNAALASLLTALANLGLITNSSS